MFYSHGMGAKDHGVESGAVKFFRELLVDVFGGERNVLEAKKSNSDSVEGATVHQIDESDAVFVLFTKRHKFISGKWSAPSGCVYETGYAKAKDVPVLGFIEEGVDLSSVGEITSYSRLKDFRIDGLKPRSKDKSNFKETIKNWRSHFTLETEGDRYDCMDISKKTLVHEDRYGIVRLSRTMKVVALPTEGRPIIFSHALSLEQPERDLPSLKELTDNQPLKAWKNNKFYLSASLMAGKQSSLEIGDPKRPKGQKDSMEFSIKFFGKFKVGDEFRYGYEFGAPKMFSPPYHSGFDILNVKKVKRASFAVCFEKSLAEKITDPIFEFCPSVGHNRRLTIDKSNDVVYSFFRVECREEMLQPGAINATWSKKS